MNQTPPALLRPAQAAAYLAISRSYLYVLIARKELQSIRLGARASGILRADLDAWVLKQGQQSKTA